MHAFHKWVAQIQKGETLKGVSIIHKQPKEHRSSKCTATITSIDKNSVKLTLNHEDNYPELPTEILIRKANVMEYGNNFRILYEQDDVLTLFVVAKLFFA